MESTTKWIRQWCREHKADDERNFERLERDMRQLREQMLETRSIR